MKDSLAFGNLRGPLGKPVMGLHSLAQKKE